ncbi:hypothetical protein AGOR_G00106230 [Albula goreensis]|uniref:Uncharacterized protein n=1 Tax=Albula goreensis TaxID=1534307 RepID=A0A8T3DE27_9TELE|nr:hypothetical protein AGOR_G00106230 [Albula goreensis]
MPFCSLVDMCPSKGSLLSSMPISSSFSKIVWCFAVSSNCVFTMLQPSALLSPTRTIFIPSISNSVFSSGSTLIIMVFLADFDFLSSPAPTDLITVSLLIVSVSDLWSSQSLSVLQMSPWSSEASEAELSALLESLSAPALALGAWKALRLVQVRMCSISSFSQLKTKPQSSHVKVRPKRGLSFMLELLPEGFFRRSQGCSALSAM